MPDIGKVLIVLFYFHLITIKNCFMKKFLLLLAVVCVLAPAEMAFASSKQLASVNLISLFSKKTKKSQPKFRPMSKGVYKIK